MNEDVAFWITGALALFLIGIYVMITKKDGLKQIVALEFMVIAANAIFIGIGFFANSNPELQTMVILSIGVGGAVIGTALVILTGMFKIKGHIDTSREVLLKW